MERYLDYKPAHIVSGARNYYVAYSVINPETGCYVVKRVKLNYIKSKRQRKEYACELVKQINGKLARGFNPYFNEHTDKLVLLSEAVMDFLKAKKREMETHIITAATFEDYKQQLTYFQRFIDVDCFVYKIKMANVNAFLDDIYITKALTAVTRNHYLQTVRTFFTWCVNHGIIAENPAKDIANVKHGTKKRVAIPESDLQLIFNFLAESGEIWYLLDCYLVYGCFIRPSEICGLKIANISFKNQTIYIPAEVSKNKKAQTVTMPKNVVMMLLDLKIYDFPSDYYICGENFKPSENKAQSRIFRDKWLTIRKELRLPDTYQFYSLKDSGITKMLSMLNVSEVRDQARHSNIAITDVYTDRSKTDGNAHIKSIDFTPSV